MVRRRGTRRVSGKRPPSKIKTDVSNPMDTTSERCPKNTKKGDSSPVPNSNVEIISEKSLFVKVIDIKKNPSKILPRNSDIIMNSVEKAQTCTTEQTINTSVKVLTDKEMPGKVISVNRVVTRSRKMDVNSISEIKISSAVVKRVRKVNKNTGKDQKESVETAKSLKTIAPKNLNDLKTEKNLHVDEDDPCLSGVIMYEEVIDEVMEESPTTCNNAISKVVIECEDIVSSVPLDKNDDLEPCIQPSSSSDCIISNNIRDMQNLKVSDSNQNDDSKVTSSSSINDVSCDIDPVNMDTSVANSLATSSNVVESEMMAISESENVEALSSLKLDPEIEPVSSSKSESYFESIFSIDEHSNERVSTDVNGGNDFKYADKISSENNNQCESVSPLLENCNKIEIPVTPFEKIVTRSKALVNSSTPVRVGQTVPPYSVGSTHKKKTKAELKEVIKSMPTQSSYIDNSCSSNAVSNNVNSNDKCNDENLVEMKPPANNKVTNLPIDTNEPDVPLVVNRCIVDETRKYMGPKRIIKNNFSNSVNTTEKSKSDISETTPKGENEIKAETNITDEVEEAENLAVCRKELPLSPTNLLNKCTPSQMEITEESKNEMEVDSVPSPIDETAFKLEEIGSDSLKSLEVPSMKEVMKNDASNDGSNDGDTEKNDDPKDDCKIANESSDIEHTIRRSRRNSAEKAKRFISAITAKDKKDVNVKTLSEMDNSSEGKPGKLTIPLDKKESVDQKMDKVNCRNLVKTKSTEKAKKEIITMSSILNEKTKPMSPKELIKKSFIAFESRSMEPPKVQNDSVKQVINKSVLEDTFIEQKDKSISYDLSSTEMEVKDYNNSLCEFKESKNQLLNCSLVSFDTDKPVKVKSRWRRTSELEMGKIINSEAMDLDSSSRQSSEDSKFDPEMKYEIASNKMTDEEVVAQRMNSFIHIDINEYLTERHISKETKRMECDCTLSKEEIFKEEKGCGEDCLNRLLLIECGSRCPLGKLCSNKSFVNREYSKCKVVNMNNKGMGIISLENIPRDKFIMEYVGEVLDPKEFRRRAKEYSKENNAHFYFMSLKADTVIDATHKGNISRFINHSCDPNAETQKWTVNGELRIGFFSKRPIAIGEEITFDYQLERYGKEAQKCYCGSSNCRGWLGEDPENDETDDDSDEESEESDNESEIDSKSDREKSKDEIEKKPTISIKKEKKKLPIRRKEIKDKTINPDIDLEEEIDKLSVSGVKNQKHTLALSRLIVRASEESSRTRLLNLTSTAATPCLRLFLDYHGLNLLWSWMIDMRSSTKLKLKIMETLFILPIQNKTILKDSKVLGIIEKWANVLRGKASLDVKERVSTEEENSNSPNDDQDERRSKEVIKENKLIDEDVLKVSNKSEMNADEVKRDADVESMKSDPDLLIQASKLLDDWVNLKEEFRIPRKQRVEQMKEHERQADMGYTDPRENQSYNRRRFRDRNESRFDKVRESRFDKKEEWNDWQNQMGKMSKAERRQQFAERVKREEKEKKESEKLWINHQDQCKALGVDPTQTAMYHPRFNSLAFFHKSTNSWLPYQEGAESYGGSGDGGVGEHHQPPPVYQLDYQNYYPPGYQSVFGQFDQSLLFQPPPPPPPQQYNIPPVHVYPPIPPHQGQPPPILQQQPPLPFQGPILPHPNPPVHHQGPILPPQRPPLPHQSPSIPHQGPPPLPLPNLPPHLGQQSYPPNYQNPPLPQQSFSPQVQGLGPQHIKNPKSQPNFNIPISIRPPLPLHPPPLPQQAAPPLPPQPAQVAPLSQHSGSFSQEGLYPQQDACINHMEVQHYPTGHPQVCSVPLKLPPKWKTAKDKEGRLYYYHVKKRISQWLFPYAAAAAAFNSEANSDSSSVDESSSSSSDEDDEEEEEEEEDDSSDLEPENNLNECEELEPDIEAPESAKKRKCKKDDTDSPILNKKPKESSLVSTIIIPREEAAEMIGITKKKIRDNKEKVKREKARAARRQRQQAALQASGIDYSSGTGGTVSSKCEADTSSGPKRKIKEIFLLKMANVVVASLNQYRKHDCKIGRITSTKDFKALAKKLTHFIMVKELRHCVNVEDLDCNDNVKHKAKDFIRKYMSKFGPVYVNPKED